MDGYVASGAVQYYQDDGLGGLGGDDGLGGLGGYAPPQQPMYGDDGLMYMPMDEPEPVKDPNDNQQELEDLLDAGLFREQSQPASQPDSGSHLPSRSQRSDDDDEDDEATEDEPEFDEFDEAGRQEQPMMVEEPQQEVQPEILDPAAMEAQRQNAWYK